MTVQNVETAPVAPPETATNWTSIVPMVLIFVVFYFLLIRPQDKRRKQHASLVSSVKRGEEIVTNTGIFGTVTKINDSDNTLMIQIADDVEIKVLKTAVADIISRSKKEDKAKITKK
ncbi:MAG: preprotein translocase subunit YajC [Rickettsiaceae bacterium]